jgi:hypothetical protein
LATVTLDFSAAHATRIQDALTVYLGLAQPATQQDYKDFIIAKTKSFVKSVEERAAIDALTPPGEVDIT